MTTPIKAIPEGFHSLTVYLAVSDAAQAIDFYKQALGAIERYRLPGPGGQGVAHAEILIGDSIVMLADESDMGLAKSPKTVGGNTAGFCLYVADTDAAFDRAVKAGADGETPRAGSILWRTHGHRDRSLGIPLEPHDARRRCVARRDDEVPGSHVRTDAAGTNGVTAGSNAEHVLVQTSTTASDALKWLQIVAGQPTSCQITTPIPRAMHQ